MACNENSTRSQCLELCVLYVFHLVQLSGQLLFFFHLPFPVMSKSQSIREEIHMISVCLNSTN